MSAHIGVVVFPGTNCEHDVVKALGMLSGRDAPAATVELVWHGERSLSHLDGVVLPGGFAHGDYLRPGAIARFSHVMDAVGRFAAEGGPVVGICNGFQVLTEAGLLPGALQKNSGLRFVCTSVGLRVCTMRTVLTGAVSQGQRLRLPVNHFEGSYTCDRTTLDRLRAEDCIVLRYEENPNGSLDDIAGVCNAAGNVVGLMPHPERACDALTGALDGVPLLRSLLEAADRHASLPA
ncbi:MAG: phosphoribosylformylglycinamidine synthase subunit PurQ [Acidimicrobiales bacterium]